MAKLKWYYLIGLSGILALVSVAIFFDAAGTSYHISVWKLVNAHIDEAVALCKHSSRSLTLPFDCAKRTEELEKHPDYWRYPVVRSGSRGSLSFTVDGRQFSHKFNDQNVEANNLSTGMDVAIKYDATDPSNFELASALQRRVGTTFWLGVVYLLPGASLLAYYLIARRWRSNPANGHHRF